MFRAAIYIMACSARNRASRRLRRLREPRYLLGVIAGLAYLFVAILGRSRANRIVDGDEPATAAPAAFLPAFGAAGPAVGGLMLLVAGAASWILPFGSGLLEFTRSETDFLFPAPVSRRQLLLYRLLRSQWAVFFGAIIIALTYPVASIPVRLRGLIGAWLFLMTCQVFFTGVTLTRARTGARVPGSRLVIWGPLAFVLLAIGVVATEAAQAFDPHRMDTALDVLRLLSDVSLAGWSHLVLLPFIAVIQPLFAGSLAAFARALMPALVVYFLLVVWVLHADEAFERLTDDFAEAQARQPARKVAAYRARPVGWTLAPTGRLEAPFVWKGMLQTLRVVDQRIMVRLIILLSWLVGVALLAARAKGFAQILGLFAAIASGFTVFVGPQMLRTDLRQDLQRLDLLKTWPVPPSVVVRGEILWPAFVITSLAWLLGAVAIVLSAAAFAGTDLGWRLSAGLAVMILMPALVLAQYTIHSGAALMFPAWVPAGWGRSRGVDAIGQRLILMGATWLLLVIVMAPGLLVGGGIALACYSLVGPWIVVVSAVSCAVVVAVEVFLVTRALGPVYERLDITSVEQGE